MLGTRGSKEQLRGGVIMPERQASRTAVITAVIRAAHQILDAHPKILDDPVAIGLVEGSSEADIRAQEPDLQQPLKRLVRSAFVVRSRFVEDQLAEAVTAGVRQYVILGAGLDTFAYRQPAWARPLRIIEVDHPASQAFKRERLGSARIPIPDNVAFCPLDFERTTLQEGLGAVAFAPQLPTFFAWLGVTQYLTAGAIEATLRLVLTLPATSGIVFSFVLPDRQLEGDDLRVATFYTALAASYGEPWITRFEPQPLRQWLLALGFSEVFHLSPEVATARYFAGRHDGLPTPVLEQLMSAVV
jgi:methyltransferase (TIGR00027 family)